MTEPEARAALNGQGYLKISKPNVTDSIWYVRLDVMLKVTSAQFDQNIEIRS